MNSFKIPNWLSVFLPNEVFDFAKKNEELLSKAEEGDALSLANLGTAIEDWVESRRQSYSISEEEENHLMKVAVDLYQASSEAGCPRGQFCFGLCLLTGEGGREIDKSKAFQLVSHAAALGLPEAQEYMDQLGYVFD